MRASTSCTRWTGHRAIEEVADADAHGGPVLGLVGGEAQGGGDGRGEIGLGLGLGAGGVVTHVAEEGDQLVEGAGGLAHQLGEVDGGVIQLHVPAQGRGVLPLVEAVDQSAQGVGVVDDGAEVAPEDRGRVRELVHQPRYQRPSSTRRAA